ncbi:MAG: ABC transporter ATP-binding protein [Negativicutes bacterium]
MAGVELHNLSKHFVLGERIIAAVQGVTTTITHGSFTVIVGKSGCGKTTLLRLLGELEELTEGQIHWTDIEKQQLLPKIGFVFQEPRLMPWLTVYENMAFSLDKALFSEAVATIVDPILNQLGLESFRDAYPVQLSGGMAQRVSLGRTLCYDPDLILMDEPFGALDYFTRKKLQHEMVELFLLQKKTVVFVTHDVSEAIYLGQKILVMDQGRIVKEIPIEMSYPRNLASSDILDIQTEILESLGSL